MLLFVVFTPHYLVYIRTVVCRLREMDAGWTFNSRDCRPYDKCSADMTYSCTCRTCAHYEGERGAREARSIIVNQYFGKLVLSLIKLIPGSNYNVRRILHVYAAGCSVRTTFWHVFYLFGAADDNANAIEYCMCTLLVAQCAPRTDMNSTFLALLPTTPRLRISRVFEEKILFGDKRK